MQDRAKMKIITRTPGETEAAGLEFARKLPENCVVGLYGDLGSGKTCFVRGAAAAFRVKETVVSPTFSLVNVYRGTRTVIHMDAYRLKTPAEMVQIGFEDYLAQGGVCFIEWAERIAPILPAGALQVRFGITGDSVREIDLPATGK
jgi:tRNA threonylcarbamoyladenosine biosynthesis protein TsaE